MLYYFGLSALKLTELACSLCAWEPNAECPRHLFGRQVLQITWIFLRGNYLRFEWKLSRMR